MRSTLALSQPASLPKGWHRTFLYCFFGDESSKGLYTGWPGPVPDLFLCLGFLGLTFVRSQSRDGRADWINCFRVPEADQSWTGPSLETLTEEESPDPRLAVIKARADEAVPYNDEQERDHMKPSRRHSQGIQPDEVVEPELLQERVLPKVGGQTRRHSEHHPDHRRAEFSEHHKRQARYSMSSMPNRNGFEAKNQAHYFMETTSTNGFPDSNIFSTFDDTASEFTPLAENPRYRARRHLRRSSMNSGASAPSVQSDSLESPPAVPHSSSPRKFRRRTSSQTSPTPPSSRFRSLSPIADYHPRRVPSPTNTEPVYYPSENSYMPTPDTSTASWSGYASLPLQPTPRSPTSTVSYASSQSYIPGSGGEAVENANGEFTVQVVRSVSDTPEGRFYKVRWANTWESKASMRAATESGKYTVKEVLESTYVNGKGLYHVRWQDTWEPEGELGDIEPVQVFWQDVAAGRRPQSHRKPFA